MPISPVVCPAAWRMESTRNETVVLPFVPVIPTSFSAFAGWWKKFAAAMARPRRAVSFLSCTQIMLRGASSGRASSLAMAVAPRSIASEMKRFPSAFDPCSAKNSEPGCALRLSQTTARISASSEPAMAIVPTPSRISRNFIVAARGVAFAWPPFISSRSLAIALNSRPLANSRGRTSPAARNARRRECRD